MRVAVVGAGVSGLAAIKCCRDEGLDVVCFERRNDLGGLWNYTENVEPGQSNVARFVMLLRNVFVQIIDGGVNTERVLVDMRVRIFEDSIGSSCSLNIVTYKCFLEVHVVGFQ